MFMVAHIKKAGKRPAVVTEKMILSRPFSENLAVSCPPTKIWWEGELQGSVEQGFIPV